MTEELGIQPEADGTLLLQREIQTDGKTYAGSTAVR